MTPNMVFNPYKKVWVDEKSEEGIKLKRLIKACKKCKKDEIYDAESQKCVKRTPKNVTKLKDFDKFCKAYRLQKIKQKNTDSLVFGKILNVKIPGGDLKIKDIIGSTKAKAAVYELEKDNRSIVKILAVMIPVVLTISSLAATNPQVFKFIQQKISELTKNNTFMKNAFARIFKQNLVTSQETFIPGQDTLEVKLDKDDSVTKEFIKKDGVGTIDINTNIANVNTKVLGIKGINPFTNLSGYKIKYDPSKQTYALIRIGFQAVYNPATTVTDLTDIVVSNTSRRAKVNLLVSRKDKLEKKIVDINRDKALINDYYRLYKMSNDYKAESISINEQIDTLSEKTKEIFPKTGVRNKLNTLERKLKKIEKDKTSVDEKIKKIEKDSDVLLLKDKKVNGLVAYIESIVSRYTAIDINMKNVNETNINAIHPVMSKELAFLEEKLIEYDNIQF